MRKTTSLVIIEDWKSIVFCPFLVPRLLRVRQKRYCLHGYEGSRAISMKKTETKVKILFIQTCFIFRYSHGFIVTFLII